MSFIVADSVKDIYSCITLKYVRKQSGAVNRRMMHQSRSYMASTVQLTYICSKDCSWRDVKFERPRSYPDRSTVKSRGDTFKPGRVTGALVQGPKLTLASDNTKKYIRREKSGSPRCRQSEVRS